MPQETLKFGEGVAEITIIDNLIYIRVLHAHNDGLAMGVIEYIDKIIDQIPSNLIRVWDASSLSAKSFNLSNECVRKVIAWSNSLISVRIVSSPPSGRAFPFVALKNLAAFDRLYCIGLCIMHLPRESHASLLS